MHQRRGRIDRRRHKVDGRRARRRDGHARDRRDDPTGRHDHKVVDADRNRIKHEPAGAVRRRRPDRLTVELQRNGRRRCREGKSHLAGDAGNRVGDARNDRDHRLEEIAGIAEPDERAAGGCRQSAMSGYSRRSASPPDHVPQQAPVRLDSHPPLRHSDGYGGAMLRLRSAVILVSTIRSFARASVRRPRGARSGGLQRRRMRRPRHRLPSGQICPR